MWFINQNIFHDFWNKLPYKYLMSFPNVFFIQSHIFNAALFKVDIFSELIMRAFLKINFHFGSLHIFIHSLARFLKNQML